MKSFPNLDDLSNYLKPLKESLSKESQLKLKKSFENSGFKI